MSNSSHDDAIARLKRFLAQEDSDAALTFVEHETGSISGGNDISNLVARMKSALENALTAGHRPTEIREMKMAARSRAATSSSGVEVHVDSRAVRIVEDEDAVFHLHGFIPAEATHLIVGDDAHAIARVDADHATVQSLLPAFFETYLELHLADSGRYPLRWDHR
jgi:hypothetical protein